MMSSLSPLGATSVSRSVTNPYRYSWFARSRTSSEIPVVVAGALIFVSISVGIRQCVDQCSIGGTVATSGWSLWNRWAEHGAGTHGYVGSRGPSPSATRNAGGLVLLDGALLDEQVEVPTDCCRRQPQAVGEGRRGERTILGDRLSDPVPGARIAGVRFWFAPVRMVGNGVGSN